MQYLLSICWFIWLKESVLTQFLTWLKPDYALTYFTYSPFKSLFACHISQTETMGKFDWGVRYIIIFRHVQFWIGLAALSYRSKKVRTVVSPAVRSVNKSRDTRNCVQTGQNMPDTRLYYKAIGIILCALIRQIRHNYDRLDDGHCDVTGHRKMSALGTAGDMVTSHDISILVWSFKEQKLFSVL